MNTAEVKKFIHLLNLHGAPWGCEPAKPQSLHLSGLHGCAEADFTKQCESRDEDTPYWEGDPVSLLVAGGDQRECFLEEMTHEL